MNTRRKHSTWSPKLSLFLAMSSFATAQSSNLTVTFFPQDSENCSPPSNASQAGGITFTTASIPIENQCFNLDELFQGPSAGNITQNTTTFSSSMETLHTVTYSIANREAFSSETNYNNIYYIQQSLGSPSQDVDNLPDRTATRLLQLYSDRDCRSAINETGAVGGRVLPWYKYSCVSDGQCNTAAISVKSFLVGDATLRWNQGWADRCGDFAYEGGGRRGREIRKGLPAVVVGLAACVILL